MYFTKDDLHHLLLDSCVATFAQAGYSIYNAKWQSLLPIKETLSQMSLHCSGAYATHSSGEQGMTTRKKNGRVLLFLRSNALTTVVSVAVTDSHSSMGLSVCCHQGRDQPGSRLSRSAFLSVVPKGAMVGGRGLTLMTVQDGAPISDRCCTYLCIITSMVILASSDDDR